MPIRGQGMPRQRQGGTWVDAEEEQGVGPVDEEEREVEYPSGEDVATGPQGEAESTNGDQDLSKLSRADLDQHARSQGLDPSQYSNKQELLDALGA